MDLDAQSSSHSACSGPSSGASCGLRRQRVRRKVGCDPPPPNWDEQSIAGPVGLEPLLIGARCGCDDAAPAPGAETKWIVAELRAIRFAQEKIQSELINLGKTQPLVLGGIAGVHEQLDILRSERSTGASHNRRCSYAVGSAKQDGYDQKNPLGIKPMVRGSAATSHLGISARLRTAAAQPSPMEPVSPLPSRKAPAQWDGWRKDAVSSCPTLLSEDSEDEPLAGPAFIEPRTVQTQKTKQEIDEELLEILEKMQAVDMSRSSTSPNGKVMEHQWSQHWGDKDLLEEPSYSVVHRLCKAFCCTRCAEAFAHVKKCPRGHVLRQRRGVHTETVCDCCRKVVFSKEKLWCCGTCGWDCCESCALLVHYHFFVVEPTNIFRVLFDMISIVALMYDLSSFLLITAFDMPISKTPWIQAQSYALASFWFIDMLLTFRTGYYHKGDLEMVPKAIAWKYIKGFFTFDLLLIACDCTLLIFSRSEIDEGEYMGQAQKILRAAKVNRFVRCVRMARVLFTSGRLDNIWEQMGVAADWRIVCELLSLIVFVVWVNHLVASTWIIIGRQSSDTGLHWTDLFQEHDRIYQYYSAMHWSMAQMGVGSVEIYPTNSNERLYNLFVLLFGMIFFSTLVSTISAKMLNMRLMNMEKLQSMAKVDRFLKQTHVSAKLAVRIHKQITERLAHQKPLTWQDVPVLNVLSLSLKTEFRIDLCMMYLPRHPLFFLWEQTDVISLHNICAKAVEFVSLSVGEQLFSAGELISSAFFVSEGTLRYNMHHKGAKGPKQNREDQIDIDVGAWITEAALWTHWTSFGSIEALTPAQMMAINAEALVTELQDNHRIFAHLAAAYANIFHSKVVLAGNELNDLHVPSTDFETICMTLPADYQKFIGLVVLRKIRQESKKLYSEVLEGEVKSGAATLLMTGPNQQDVKRVVAVGNLRLVRSDRRIFTEIGTWSQNTGKVVPAAREPGTKFKKNEDPNDTFKRLMKSKLAPLKDHVSLQEITKDFTWGYSPFLKMVTGYFETIFETTLDPTFSHEELDTMVMSDTVKEVCCPVCPPQDVYCITAGERVGLFAWLTEDEFVYLKSPSGEPHLHSWLASLKMRASDEAIKLRHTAFGVNVSMNSGANRRKTKDDAEDQKRTPRKWWPSVPVLFGRSSRE